jgi:uncharacterized protein (DUF2062 family)
MGWRRAVRYSRLRITRLSDSAHKIAMGLSLGMAVSFSPIVGTHFIQVLGLAWLLRANVLASIIGTFIGNPWTYPFIWWGSIKFGAFLISFFGLTAAAHNFPADINFSMLWDIIRHEPVRIFLPWMLGSHILALLLFFPSYAGFYRVVVGAQHARSKARLRKVHKVAKEVTGQKE